MRSGIHLLPSTKEPLSSWWRMQVPHPLGIRGQPNAEELFRQYLKNTPDVAGQLSKAYNVRKTHERAQGKHDPLLAPHGFFRALRYGNNLHAVEFLKTFGPLKLSLPERLGTETLVVSFEEFWAMHRRFCLVAELWESLDDPERLRGAWRTVYQHRAQASSAEELPMGALAILDSSGAEQWEALALPWKAEQNPFEKWLPSALTSTLRDHALSLIHRELNLHMRQRAFVWERGWESTGRKFRPVTHVDSLWSMIWELFGLDTAGLSWRRCPHCQKLFYPKRKDQFYCTPRQQALASKRRYASWLRAQKKRASRQKKRSRVSKEVKNDL